MHKKFGTGILGIAIWAVILLTGCQSINNSGKNRVYIVSCENAYAPFSMQINGTYKGIDVEILDAVAKASGFRYTLKPMPFSGLIPALKANQIDGAISAISITPQRKKSVDFSDSYYHADMAIITEKTNTNINAISNLKDKTIAVQKGTDGATFAETNQTKYNLHLAYFEDSPSMFQAVENKNADFCVDDYPVIAYKLKMTPHANLKIAIHAVDGEGTDYAFAVNKGANAQLLQLFNAGLKKIKANGEYDKVLSEYI